MKFTFGWKWYCYFCLCSLVFFHPLGFSLWICFCVKCISCIFHIVRFCVLIHCASMRFLTWKLRPFTLSVIIESYWICFVTILFSCYWLTFFPSYLADYLAKYIHYIRPLWIGNFTDSILDNFYHRNHFSIKVKRVLQSVLDCGRSCFLLEVELLYSKLFWSLIFWDKICALIWTV